MTTTEKVYIKELCSICNNKNKNLCNITYTFDDKLKCIYYERCKKKYRQNG